MNIVIYNIYIITESLKKNLKDGRSHFLKLKKSEKYEHYRKLFLDLNTFHNQNVVSSS